MEGLAGLARYPLRDTEIEVAGRRWVVTSVQDQEALVARVRTDEDLERFPYGLMLWASAIGLAAHLAEDPSLVRGRTVVELGAGAGLPGMVACHLGGMVTQTDYHEEALALARHNARRNGLPDMVIARADWREGRPAGRYEVVLGSDVLYDRALHAPLAALLPGLLAPGGVALISDPLRPLAFDFLDSLERSGAAVEVDSRWVAWDAGCREVALFTLRFGS